MLEVLACPPCLFYAIYKRASKVSINKLKNVEAVTEQMCQNSYTLHANPNLFFLSLSFFWGGGGGGCIP
jgi:hypothetical protein